MRRALATLALAACVARALAAGPPVDSDARRPVDLVDVAALDPTIRRDVRYATARNLTGRPLYDARTVRVLLQRPAAEGLVRVQQALAADGYALVILDAYRPWRVTRALWDATPPGRRGFVADPAVGSRHNRGCAVDVTLADRASGRELAMPSDYDEMTERASPVYAGGDASARARRDRLRAAMEREGFFVHPAEWWHFDYKDWRDYPVLDVPFDAVPAIERMVVPSLDLAHATVVDLTYAFDETTLYWPNAPSGFSLRALAHGRTDAGFFYAANAFAAPEHGGTHLDAPIHFFDGGAAVDAVPVDRLVRPAVVIDVRAAAAERRDYRLTARDVVEFERRHGRIFPGTVVLLRTGWGVYWPDRTAYFGDATPGRTTALHFPSYGAEAATLLVRERRVVALGVDTPSIDYGPSQDFAVHRIAAAAGVVGLENVAQLDAVPETGAWVAALPMKIGGGSGAPLRLVAFVPR